MQQDELARLFSANLNITQAPSHLEQPHPQPEQHEVADQPVQQQGPLPNPQPIFYASTHYTHTHHVVPIRHIPQKPSEILIEASELEAILRRNNIDPTLLFPSQIDLFQSADNDQRLRLLELWRISPPQGGQGVPQGMDYNTSRQLYDWPPTSLAQEEAMAKLRYDKMTEERVKTEAVEKHQRHLDQSMDDGQGESAAVQATRNLLTSSPDTRNAEPYIVSGYDMLAQREYEESCLKSDSLLRETTKYNQATDPVYQGSAEWEKDVGSLLDMENQYGQFAMAREGAYPIYADDEMVM